MGVFVMSNKFILDGELESPCYTSIFKVVAEMKKHLA